MGKRYTTEGFRESLAKKQPNLTLLSECNFNKDRVIVRCEIHNHTYEVQARFLIAKKYCGCKKCADDLCSKTRSMGRDEFIRKAIGKHGDRYDYSNVEYKNSQTKVHIVCKDHGDFWMIPNNHLKGQKCNDCANIELSKNGRDTTEIFIEKALKAWGNQYDYSKVDYVNSITKVCIICSDHGEFWTRPSNHLQMKGCPKCNESHLERFVSNILIENNITFTFQYRPEWLGKKSLDFYLTDYNIAIECQGKQHFGDTSFYGGLDSLKYTVKCDILKNNQCLENGIKLFYITDQTQFKNPMLESELFENIYNEQNSLCAGHKSKIPLKTLFIELLNKEGVKTK